jgi:uncharacterized protein
MPLNPRELCISVFSRGLRQLKLMLQKGEAHASERGSDALQLLDAALAPNMHNLAIQAHWAMEGAKLAVARLCGTPYAPVAGEAKSYAELYQRLDATLSALETLPEQALEGALERVIEIEHRGGAMKFTGSQFLLEFAIPSFFFHVTTAYGILRHAGVEITKGDFLGSVG